MEHCLVCKDACARGEGRREGELKREKWFRQRSDVLAVVDDNWAAEVWKKLVQNKQRCVCCVVLCRVVSCCVVSCCVVSCCVVLCRRRKTHPAGDERGYVVHTLRQEP